MKFIVCEKELQDNRKYSNKMTEQERFENEVNKTLEGINSKEDSNCIKVCDTPKILLDYGFKQLPMLYRKGHLRNAVEEKDGEKHTHGLMIKQIYSLPKLLSEPVVILKSNNEKTRDIPIMILNDCDKDKMPLFTTIELNSMKMYEFRLIESNFILSLYGKNHFDSIITNSISKEILIYYDKEKVQNIDCLYGTHLFDRCSCFEPNKILQYY